VLEYSEVVDGFSFVGVVFLGRLVWEHCREADYSRQQCSNQGHGSECSIVLTVGVILWVLNWRKVQVEVIIELQSGRDHSRNPGVV